MLTQDRDKLRMEVSEPEYTILETPELHVSSPQNPVEEIWKITVHPEGKVDHTRIDIPFK